MVNIINKRRGLQIGGSLLLLALLMIPLFAFANSSQNIGEIAEQITDTFENVVKLIVAVCYVAGIGFAAAGIMKFKQHKDNPTQVPLSGPITMVFIAAALVWLPSVMGTIGETVFGDGSGSNVGGSDGSGFNLGP